MEKKWYKVTFYAPMTESDVKAMGKCFFDTMSQTMEIDGCEDLKMELEQEDERADIVLEEDSYSLDMRTGQIKIEKSIFDDFVKGSYINIKFIDEEHQPVNQYEMVDENDEYIYCEFLTALN